MMAAINWERWLMQYGTFDDTRREFVITRPDTPWPWINYLGQGDYGAIISNNAGGYSFHKSPGENRLLRYRFNAVPCDRPGRYIYLRDADDGAYWSTSWSPVQHPMEKHPTVCRHGLGYTRIESHFRDIASDTLYLVPPGDPVELWQLTVTNRSDHERTLDIFTYCEFGFPYFISETNLQAILYAARTACRDGIIDYTTPIIGWRTRYAFFASTLDPVGFDAQREAFIGPWRGEDRPLAVERGACTGACGAGGNAVGCLQLRIQLAPGESRQAVFILGEGPADTTGVAMRRKYADPATVQSALDAIRAYWDERLDTLQTEAPDPDFSRMVNIWNAYQAHVTFHWSRSATLIEAGLRDGLGYRDTFQDCLGVMHAVPDACRERMVDLLRGQEQAGCALHKVQPLTLETGRGETVPEGEIWSDDHLWIAIGIAAYVRETGDLDFLDRRVPWLDQGEATVFEHARQGIAYAWAHRGAHGLLLSLAADWNDALQLGEGGQSVWVSMQFCKACDVLAELAEATDRTAEADTLRAMRAEMADTIESQAWDGGWYMRGKMADGEPFGASASRVARIWLNPQTWSVIAGIAPHERAIQAMDAVWEHLTSPHGMHLFTPPHAGYEEDVPGRVSYPPGLKENGAIFCHPNPWAMIAETMLRRGDKAYAVYRALLPNGGADHDLRCIEPYVYGQFVTGRADSRFGKAHNPWLTGTASWCYAAATQYILGVRAELAGLRIDPCIPPEWDGFTVRRRFRGADYTIRVDNPQHRSCGVTALRIDGVRQPGSLVPAAPAGSAVTVEVTLEAE